MLTIVIFYSNTRRELGFHGAKGMGGGGAFFLQFNESPVGEMLNVDPQE